MTRSMEIVNLRATLTGVYHALKPLSYFVSFLQNLRLVLLNPRCNEKIGSGAIIKSP